MGVGNFAVSVRLSQTFCSKVLLHKWKTVQYVAVVITAVGIFGIHFLRRSVTEIFFNKLTSYWHLIIIIVSSSIQINGKDSMNFYLQIHRTFGT